MVMGRLSSHDLLDPGLGLQGSRGLGGRRVGLLLLLLLLDDDDVGLEVPPDAWFRD